MRRSSLLLLLFCLLTLSCYQLGIEAAFADDPTRATSIELGASLIEQDGQIVVRSLLKDGKADRAGVQVGDRVLGINDAEISSIAEAEASLASAGSDRSLTLILERNNDQLVLAKIRGLAKAKASAGKTDVTDVAKTTDKANSHFLSMKNFTPYARKRVEAAVMSTLDGEVPSPQPNPSATDLTARRTTVVETMVEPEAPTPTAAPIVQVSAPTPPQPIQAPVATLQTIAVQPPVLQPPVLQPPVLQSIVPHSFLPNQQAPRQQVLLPPNNQRSLPQQTFRPSPIGSLRYQQNVQPSVIPQRAPRPNAVPQQPSPTRGGFFQRLRARRIPQN